MKIFLFRLTSALNVSANTLKKIRNLSRSRWRAKQRFSNNKVAPHKLFKRFLFCFTIIHDRPFAVLPNKPKQLVHYLFGVINNNREYRLLNLQRNLHREIVRLQCSLSMQRTLNTKRHFHRKENRNWQILLYLRFFVIYDSLFIILQINQEKLAYESVFEEEFNSTFAAKLICDGRLFVFWTGIVISMF